MGEWCGSSSRCSKEKTGFPQSLLSQPTNFNPYGPTPPYRYKSWDLLSHCVPGRKRRHICPFSALNLPSSRKSRLTGPTIQRVGSDLLLHKFPVDLIDSMHRCLDQRLQTQLVDLPRYTL